MNATMAIGDILDTIQEVIVFKSGIYLNFDEIISISKEINEEFHDMLSGDKTSFFDFALRS